MESVKENAGGQAGVEVFGLPSDETAASTPGKSTLKTPVLKSRSTETEVQRKKVLALLRNGAKQPRAGRKVSPQHHRQSHACRHARYEASKADWIRQNPTATPVEYDAAMLRLARECGV